MVCLSLFRFITVGALSPKQMKLQVGEKEIPLSCTGFKKSKGWGFCKFSVPLAEALALPSKNTVAVTYTHPLGQQVSFPLTYCAMPRNLFMGLRGPMAVDKDTQTVAIFRQSLENHLMLYVRSVNVTDKISQRFKQTVAYGVSLFWHTKKAKKLILLYEKNGGKYEESASVLYEELLNQGINNAYFVITKDSSYLPRVAEQYRKNLVYKYTFRHYLYFFKTQNFIGTEAIAHAIDLKTFNLLALKKIANKNLNYVFLQHGVMYMVSLDSESRELFARKVLKGKYRVVVSSQKEADHFTTLGRHLPEDIYITGLPKFDRNIHYPNADKIVIMPTWRPWEINQARGDFANTGYCRMMMDLYENLPEHLRKKTVILPGEDDSPIGEPEDCT
ncbi:MAG: CDP-glycerol glycerophosphotransferase family protein [Clostridia bacterium]|nr:CDP-glycerol glycerophosphotransferase family protein [Clostridia bacterium]